MSNTAHEGMDDMGEWAEAHPITRRAHRALPLPADWPHRRAFIPQGCDQQGRLTPSIKPADQFPVVADRMPESFDADEGDPMTAREALIFWLTVCAPSIGGVALMALILWMTKP